MQAFFTFFHADILILGSLSRQITLNQKQLHELTKLGEGFTTEFKISGTKNIGRELCAFANATGGTLLIGVTDSGNPVGVKDHNKLKSEIQSIARSVEPPLVLDMESVRDVLIVSIPAQNSKPYSFAGKFYLRDGASSQQMSRNEIREFFFQEGVIHFDETPCDTFRLDTDLDDSNWSLFAKRANIPDGMKPKNALENLHLITKEKITQAGAWLLAKDITRFNISGNVSCALFMGSDKDRILDRKDFTGDVYSMIDSLMTYILSKINTELTIESVQRKERPELPEEALRETVVNALAHRDYRSTANVQVYIFQDRLEIVSPGGLPAGMTAKDLGKKSMPRNPLLFSILYRMNAVEHIGSGIQRIRKACEDYGVQAPILKVEDNWVTVTFLRPAVGRILTDQDTDQDTDQVKLLMQVLRHRTLSASELMEFLTLRHRPNLRDNYLHPALNLGLVEMTMPEKPTSRLQRYRLTNKGKKLLDSQTKGSV